MSSCLLALTCLQAYGNKIDQDMMIGAMDAITALNRTILGKASTSLCKAAGYCSVGVDEGWEACGVGVNGTQHDTQGRPTVNLTRFPSMKSMVNYGHSKGLEVGWYQNGCKCAEKQDVPLNYKGDVESLFEFGFDGVKMDVWSTALLTAASCRRLPTHSLPDCTVSQVRCRPTNSCLVLAFVCVGLRGAEEHDALRGTNARDRAELFNREPQEARGADGLSSRRCQLVPNAGLLPLQLVQVIARH
jgi:hypothetical protein